MYGSRILEGVAYIMPDAHTTCEMAEASTHEQDAPDGYGDDQRSLVEEESRVRSKLSNERTYAAWLRAATAVTVVGLAVARFLAEEEKNEVLFLAFGGAYVFAGVGLFVFAAHNYFTSRKQMKRKDFHEPRKFLIAIAVILSLLSLGLIGIIGYEILVASGQ